MADSETMYSTDEVVSTAEVTPVMAEPVLETEASTDNVELVEGEGEELLDEEITEELIIEDFTIDGICGVY